ncbi:MAG: hypothetical protein RO009_22990 [Pseudorhodoplanes sp.]|nr:hypothetical protein [Pseudorhodoplanes sp.]
MPTELDLGRVIVIARSGVLGETNSQLLLLLAASVQRRRTIAGAHLQNFEAVGDDVIWSIPPFFRKTANKRRSKRPHVLPLSGWGADAFRA